MGSQSSSEHAAERSALNHSRVKLSTGRPAKRGVCEKEAGQGSLRTGIHGKPPGRPPIMHCPAHQVLRKSPCSLIRGSGDNACVSLHVSLARFGQLHSSRTGWSTRPAPPARENQDEPTGFVYPAGMTRLPATPGYAVPGTAVKPKATAGQSRSLTSPPGSPPPGGKPFCESHGDGGGGGQRQGTEATTSAT